MAERTIPIRTKLLYGVGDTALALKNSAISQFLLFFYADILRSAPELIGIALFVGKIWDAVTDPIMGYLSDATRSRWGRRRPYVLLSAVPMGLFFYLLFAPPVMSALANVVYLTVIGIALYTCFTVYATPYLAWGAELTRDYHERTEVVQVRSLFGVVGGVIGAVAPIMIAQRFLDPREGYQWMGAALGLVIAASGLITGVSVGDRPNRGAPPAAWRHFASGLRHTFSNREFTIVFTTFCLMTVSVAIGQSVQLIVIKYRLGMYDFFPVIALVFALSFAASFPLWLKISRRFGKQRALLGGLAFGCVVPFGWLLVQPGQHAAMLGFMVAAGVLSGSITLAASQAADVIDVDELNTGEQRAGAYFGIWTLGLKTAAAVGMLLGGLLLSLVGYEPDQVQGSDTMWWLVMMVSPLQALVNFLGVLVFRRVRITEADVHQVQASLDVQRRARQSAAAAKSD